MNARHTLHFAYDTGMTKDDIDEVVLVGGTTRIPKVKNMLRYDLNCNQHVSHVIMLS